MFKLNRPTIPQKSSSQFIFIPAYQTAFDAVKISATCCLQHGINFRLFFSWRSAEEVSAVMYCTIINVGLQLLTQQFLRWGMALPWEIEAGHVCPRPVLLSRSARPRPLSAPPLATSAAGTLQCNNKLQTTASFRRRWRYISLTMAWLGAQIAPDDATRRLADFPRDYVTVGR